MTTLLMTILLVHGYDDPRVARSTRVESFRTDEHMTGSQFVDLVLAPKRREARTRVCSDLPRPVQALAGHGSAEDSAYTVKRHYSIHRAPPIAKSCVSASPGVNPIDGAHTVCLLACGVQREAAANHSYTKAKRRPNSRIAGNSSACNVLRAERVGPGHNPNG